MRHPLFLLPALLLACSSPEETGLRLTLELPSTVVVDQVGIEASRSGAPPIERLYPEAAASPLESGVTVLLLFSDPWVGGEVKLVVSGRASGDDVAGAELTETLEAGVVLARRVALRPLCTDSCTAGETECVGDAVRLCSRDAAGCAGWGPPEPCPASAPFCSNGACGEKCVDECKTNERRCAGDASYQVCGEHDSDSCLDWSAALGCGANETCQAGGTCALDCGGSPCACKPGEEKPCADVGECKGGLRRCGADGTFGACEWTVGPSAELCDGKDNDCNGAADDGLVAPACAQQAGVCAGAKKSCGGAGGWKACGATEYGAQASGQGQTYEAEETLCDSVDNDCDGKTDEPVSCCQPSCAGKACGAPDGCGGACQSGTCPANATCKAGKCECTGAACGAACCGPKEVCSKGSCCLPDCSTAECGVDPVCGAPCGTCSPPLSCSTYYKDLDGDLVGGDSAIQACSQPAGYVGTTGDCEDGNQNVFPGQTKWFSSSYQSSKGVASFDYDCSGAEENKYNDPKCGSVSCSSASKGIHCMSGCGNPSMVCIRGTNGYYQWYKDATVVCH
jgi:hypothetical protein